MSPFASLVSDFLEAHWRHDPPNATQVGIHRYDHELPDPSPDALAEWSQTLKTFQRRFETADPATLTRDEALDRRWALAVIDRDLLDHELDIARRAPHRHFQSVNIGLHDLLINQFMSAEERQSALLSRLKATPDYLDVARQALSLSAIPSIWIDYSQLIARSTLRFLTDAIPQAAGEVPGLEAEVKTAARGAAQAVDDFATYLRDNGSQAQGDFAIGRENFDRMLQKFHLLDMDADQLYDFGLEWIDRYEREMTQLAKEMDPTADWVTALERVKDDHPPAADLLKAYTDETLLARQHCLDHDLITFPEGESAVLEWTPLFMRATSPIAKPWTSPAFEPGLASKWYITPVDSEASPERQQQHLRDSSWAWIRGISQHEMYPGHHLHKVISKQVATPLRLQFWSPVYGEGWGLYTEELWHETGGMPDPGMVLMKLRNGLWRAVRIIVDVGLHARGMTPAESVRWLSEKARLEPRWAESETRGYTTRPTYPSSYRVGLSMVMDLREKYKAKLGSEYTLKKFHDTLMQYSVLPMTLVQEAMLGE